MPSHLRFLHRGRTSSPRQQGDLEPDPEPPPHHHHSTALIDADGPVWAAVPPGLLRLFQSERVLI